MRGLGLAVVAAVVLSGCGTTGAAPPPASAVTLPHAFARVPPPTPVTLEEAGQALPTWPADLLPIEPEQLAPPGVSTVLCDRVDEDRSRALFRGAELLRAAGWQAGVESTESLHQSLRGIRGLLQLRGGAAHERDEDGCLRIGLTLSHRITLADARVVMPQLEEVRIVEPAHQEHDAIVVGLCVDHGGIEHAVTRVADGLRAEAWQFGNELSPERVLVASREGVALRAVFEPAGAGCARTSTTVMRGPKLYRGPVAVTLSLERQP